MNALAELRKRAGTRANPVNRANPPDSQPSISRISTISRGTVANPPANPADALRWHLLDLADDEGIRTTVISELDADDLLDAEGMSDAALREWLRLRDDARIMARGLVPWRWNGEQASICAGCGPVALWPGAPDRVLACPWCWHRRRGIGPARPGVTCGTCEHYGADELNPTGGAGRCAQAVAGPHWPHAPIRCERWRPMEAKNGTAAD